MKKRHCSRLGGLSCWFTLLLRFNVSGIFHRHRLEFGENLADSSRVRIMMMTTLSEFRVKKRSVTSACHIGRSWYITLKHAFHERLEALFDWKFSSQCPEL